MLIIDDDASMARYLSTYLARHNFECSTVGSGEEAIRMFRVYDPTLVLLDVAPTLAMYEQTTEAFARAYWHWFFLIQPAPLPERLIREFATGVSRVVVVEEHEDIVAGQRASWAIESNNQRKIAFNQGCFCIWILIVRRVVDCWGVEFRFFLRRNRCFG